MKERNKRTEWKNGMENGKAIELKRTINKLIEKKLSVKEISQLLDISYDKIESILKEDITI